MREERLAVLAKWAKERLETSLEKRVDFGPAWAIFENQRQEQLRFVNDEMKVQMFTAVGMMQEAMGLDAVDLVMDTWYRHGNEEERKEAAAGNFVRKGPMPSELPAAERLEAITFIHLHKLGMSSERSWHSTWPYRKERGKAVFSQPAPLIVPGSGLVEQGIVRWVTDGRHIMTRWAARRGFARKEA